MSSPVSPDLSLCGDGYVLVNLGCKVNRVESDGFEQLLQRAGFCPAGEGPAGLVVVNTCTVTGEAEKKTRKAVRQAVRNHPKALVVVTGCAAAIAPDVFKEMGNRVAVVPKAQVDMFLRQLIPPCAIAEDATVGTEECPSQGVPQAVAELSRTRRGVKVQDGCNNACTYCIVHVARGHATSRPAPLVVAEAKALAEAGVGEVVLSGINLGSYQFEGLYLHHLLDQLLAETEGMPVRFRISSIEPMDVSDELIDLLAASQGRLCRHLHLPLQSGSSKVLEEMARPYNRDQFEGLVQCLYEACPSLSLTTDIIAGFPGETEAEFQETLEVAQACRFTKIHAFPYSQREGTPAAVRADQVPSAEKSHRARQLRQLAAQLRREDFARRVGTQEWAVVEEPGRACTESYYEIEVPRGHRPGELVKATMPKAFLS